MVHRILSVVELGLEHVVRPAQQPNVVDLMLESADMGSLTEIRVAPNWTEELKRIAKAD